jgi:hypothetical protein
VSIFVKHIQGFDELWHSMPNGGIALGDFAESWLRVWWRKVAASATCVEQSYLSVRETLERIAFPWATFYRWYDLCQTGGPEALGDRRPCPKRVWNRIPDVIRQQIIQLALDEPELSPRELAVSFTDQHSYFVSEASVYRLLKAQDLITSPRSS